MRNGSARSHALTLARTELTDPGTLPSTLGLRPRRYPAACSKGLANRVANDRAVKLDLRRIASRWVSCRPSQHRIRLRVTSDMPFLFCGAAWQQSETSSLTKPRMAVRTRSAVGLASGFTLTSFESNSNKSRGMCLLSHDSMSSGVGMNLGGVTSLSKVHRQVGSETHPGYRNISACSASKSSVSPYGRCRKRSLCRIIPAYPHQITWDGAWRYRTDPMTTYRRESRRDDTSHVSP
jgi:hypothetical protein